MLAAAGNRRGIAFASSISVGVLAILAGFFGLWEAEILVAWELVVGVAMLVLGMGALSGVSWVFKRARENLEFGNGTGSAERAGRRLSDREREEEVKRVPIIRRRKSQEERVKGREAGQGW